MTQEDAKYISEVLKAYSEGKTIEYRMTDTSAWTSTEHYSFNDPNVYHYRVKPEPKLRPYANAKEFLKALKEHGPFLTFDESTDDYLTPIRIYDEGFNFQYSDSCCHYRYDRILKAKWQDGTPCGIMEE